MSSGFVTKDSLTVKPFPNPPATVAPLSSRVYHDVYDLVYQLLREKGEITLQDIARPARALFDQGDILQDGSAAYRVLYDINRKESLKIRKGTKPGQKEGQTAPVFYLSL